MSTADPTGATTSRFWRGVNHLIISTFHAVLRMTTRRRYRNLDRIPATGGAIVVSNHISFLDAFMLPVAVRRAGRNPLGMGKIELFRIPVVGGWFTKIGHVAVDRRAADPAAALEPAAAALRAGTVLCVYPEGTINATPEKGLIEGRTGVARLALASGVPIVPVGQWGPHHALSASGKLAMIRRVRIFGWFRENRHPRRPMCELIVGEPIRPDEMIAAAQSTTGEPDLRAATDLVMTRIAALVVEASGLPETGTLNAGTPLHKRGAHSKES